jgi:hypothetical protein
VTLRPRPPERLEKILARVAREQGIDQERLRRWVSFLAICGVLERATAEGLVGGYYVKGGVAMALRFAQRARATKDLDLVLEGDRRTRLRSLDLALKLGVDEFSFRLKAPIHEMDLADTVRVDVAIQHRTRAWQTVEVYLGPTSSTTIDLVEPTIVGLKEMGVPVTSPVRCISLSEQVAQKLHACTAPKLNYSAALVAAQRVFHERGTHDFPPEFVVPMLWRPELETLATQLSFPVSSAAELKGCSGRPSDGLRLRREPWSTESWVQKHTIEQPRISAYP